MAIRAGDVKMLSVTYISGFITRLLCNGSCDACKACLISEAQSPTDVYMVYKECSSTVHTRTCPTEKFVETLGTEVTVLEGMILEVAYLDIIEYCITSANKERVSFDWIRLTGCLLHHQRIEDENMRSVTRISVPWWCKQKNESLGEATRRKVIKRKFQFLSQK